MSISRRRMALGKEEPSIQPLNVFLIKTGTKEFHDALEEDQVKNLDEYALKRTAPFKGSLFLAPQRKAPPKWLRFLEGGVDERLKKLYNASTSAILFIRSSNRILAFTFGYGRTLLRQSRIERAFGLRVVLNTVDEEGLSSVDSKTVQELTVHTRRQTSRASRLSVFGIDKEEDLLGSMTGVPRDLSFARKVTGADALQMSTPLDFNSLGEKCTAIMSAYRSNEYKSRGYDFVDHVQKVSDPEIIESLDKSLAEALVSRDFDRIHMAPPEIIDWNSVDGFSFAKAAEPVPDLSLEEFFKQIKNAEDISVERLKKGQKVFLHSTNSGEVVPKWSVYRVLVAQHERKGRQYSLSGGDWYEIEKNFAAGIDRRLARIKPAKLGLPKAKQYEDEGDYNERVALKRGFYCMDRKFARADGDRIELCDLYHSSSRQFIHVKWWKASSTLSHLFAQGRISAETFLSDENFRNEARELFREKAASIAGHIPASRPDPANYRVVFGIIKAGRGWKRSLPFFSRLNLVRAAESITRLGFDVRLEQIEVED